MNIRYPVEINIHGELVDANGTLLAKDVEEGALREVFSNLKDDFETYCNDSIDSDDEIKIVG